MRNSDDSEEEEAVDLVEETDDKATTFKEDIDSSCDFLVTAATPFSTRLISGVPIRAMMSFDEHKKPTPNANRENLSLLSEI